mmetsp:Transcript_10322/g.15619  ORF Transcript_10322/g.15619 Transcript_10322/m.15619 type:complete len:163 (+) Transcript_10322:390-878(+)
MKSIVVLVSSKDVGDVHRLKNYNVEYISQVLGGTLDGCIVSAYTSQTEMERDMLVSLDEVPDQHVFSESLEDYQFGPDGSLPAGVSLRSALGAQWNDVCNTCEKHPQLRKELSEALKIIAQKGRKLDTEKMSNSEKKGETVSIITGRYNGSARVYNTKINPL